MDTNEYAKLANKKWNEWVSEQGIFMFAVRNDLEEFVLHGKQEAEIFLEPWKSDKIKPKGNSPNWPGDLKMCKTVEQLCGDALCNITMAEFGCGGGRLAIPFAKRVKFYYGYDICDKAIDIAKGLAVAQNVHNVKLFAAPRIIDQIPLEFLDFVFSYIVLQHISNKETVELSIRDIYSLLKKDAVARIHVRISTGGYETEDDCVHGIGLPEQWYLDLCKSLNVEVLEFVDDGNHEAKFLTFRK